ncbi:HAD-like domain-containing protein, partial [Pelagophyceae sp. CCMP2097]
LVLDLDETLVCAHPALFQDRGYAASANTFLQVFGDDGVRCRPFVKDLLAAAWRLGFEVVVWTAGHEDYAAPVIDALELLARTEEPGFRVSHRLYRDSCTVVQASRVRGGHLMMIKDLARLQRPLRKTLIVDNNPDAFHWHTQNSIAIRDFEGDAEDADLVDLGAFLTKIAAFEDIRPALKA